jgi:hypothetical protein
MTYIALRSDEDFRSGKSDLIRAKFFSDYDASNDEEVDIWQEITDYMTDRGFYRTHLPSNTIPHTIRYEKGERNTEGYESYILWELQGVEG